MTEEKFREERERPDALPGTTQRVRTGYGKVYVDINVDEDGDPFEVFIATGRSGGYTNAMCEALAKTISTALRSGTDPEAIADNLMGIRMDKIMEDNGDKIYSVPDAVGIAMKRMMEGRPGRPVREGWDGEDAEDGPKSPDDYQFMFDLTGEGDSP